MIISLKEARKILGKNISDKMSDDELEKTILLMSDIASDFLKKAHNNPGWIQDIKKLANDSNSERSNTEV